MEWPLYGRCVALIGPPGIGKSTLLRHLAAQAGPDVPMLLDYATPESAAALAASHPDRCVFITAASHGFLHRWHEQRPFPQPVEAVISAILAHPELTQLAEMAIAVSEGTRLPAGGDPLAARIKNRGA